LRYVYLNGDPDPLRQRVKERKGHYFGADLLKSQFETLEEPEGITMVDVAGKPEDVVINVRAVLGV